MYHRFSRHVSGDRNMKGSEMKLGSVKPTSAFSFCLTAGTIQSRGEFRPASDCWEKISIKGLYAAWRQSKSR